MTKKLGSEILVECLENENVEYVFGIPGEQTVPVMEEFRKSDIKFVATRHEQGAAFMADIYARISGNVGVCLATLGPGATNLVTGVGNASLDHSSVVAITSQRATTEQHKHSHQFVDTNEIFSAVTKLTDDIKRTETIPEQVRKAFEVARREKQGGTHLEIPIDVTLEATDESPINITQNEVSPDGVQRENIRQALDIVENSTNPIIISGQGVITQNASNQLSRFASESGIPVVTTFMGKGSISAKHSKSVGTIGFSKDDYAMDAVKQSDLVLTIGYDYIEFHPDNWNIGEEKDIIHIDSTPPEIDKDYGTEITLVGNVSRILEQMNTQVEEYVADDYATKLKTNFQRNLDDEYAENNTAPFTPQQIVSSVREALAETDILLSDVGSHKYWFSRRYKTYNPNTFLVSNGFASMGVALPGAVSASLYSDENVVAVTGDGGFLMNVQELETAKRLDVSPTVVVLDDSEYTAITMEQNTEYDELYGASFDNPDFVKLAESFGLEGYRVTNSQEMTKKINKATKTDNLSIVSIPIDSYESYLLEQKY